MQDKLFEKAAAGKIELVWNSGIDEVLGDDSGVTGVRVKNLQDDSTHDIAATGFFVAIGHTPNTGIFDGQLDMHDGYIKIRTGLEGMATMTSVPGVFAAGDVADHVYRQAVTSAGFGCMAALDAERWLDQLSPAA
jgi:thioredoxin reductase (NADPH)